MPAPWRVELQHCRRTGNEEEVRDEGDEEEGGKDFSLGESLLTHTSLLRSL